MILYWDASQKFFPAGAVRRVAGLIPKLALQACKPVLL
jgi:hypothetical protein